ncbi:MAG: ABC transporter permease [Candidatus Nanopelagicales bacterium]
MTSIAEKTSVLQYRSLIWNFAQRDLKSRYKGTALGWAWSLMVPLATLGMYSVVFGIIFRASAPNFGNGRQAVFAVWLFVGLVAYGFFSASITTSMGSMLGTGILLKKVYFPAYAPVVGSLIAVGFQSLIESTILLVVLAAFGNVGWTWLLAPAWAAIFFVFAAGFAMVFSVGGIYFRDLAPLIGVLLQLFFFSTPIMYPISMIPEEWYGIPFREIISSNPLSKFIELLRDVLYDLDTGTIADWMTILAWAVASLLVGAFVVKRYGRDLGEQI